MLFLISQPPLLQIQAAFHLLALLPLERNAEVRGRGPCLTYLAFPLLLLLLVMLILLLLLLQLRAGFSMPSCPSPTHSLLPLMLRQK